jgi:predicted  nucleic acid-binding Zn-ribbon protein
VSDAERLEELLEKDRWIDRLRAQREHLAEAEDLATVETELRALAARLAVVDEQRRTARDEFESAEDRATSLRRRRDELAARLDTPLPARDAAAVQDELAKVTVRLDDAEDVEVGALLALEPLEEETKSIRAEASPLAARRKALQESLVELRANLDDELVHHRQQRVAVREALGEPLGSRYDRALQQAGVSGAARVDQGRCDGCRVGLPPADVDRWRTGGAIMDCPHCGRLLLPC